MPSRFLTLWSMLAKPAAQTQQSPSGKTKKSTATTTTTKKDQPSNSTQVRYRPGYTSTTMVIPVYGEQDDEEAFPTQLQLREREREPKSVQPSGGQKKNERDPVPIRAEKQQQLRKESKSSSQLHQLGGHRKEVQPPADDSRSRTLTRSASLFRRRSSHFFFRRSEQKSPSGGGRNCVPPTAACSSPNISKNHQSADSLASLPGKRLLDRAGNNIPSESSHCSSKPVPKSLSVGGLTSHRSSLRVCQAKRVAPPVVPDPSGATVHRHSGTSFDSTGGSLSSAESTASGFSSTGGFSSSGGADHRNSSVSGILDGGDDYSLLPPPPDSPAACSSQPTTPAKHLHMYRGDGEPLYSTRNPTSPSFGNPGGIFSYPTKNSNGIYGQIGAHQTYRPMSTGTMDSSALQGQQNAPTTLLPGPNYSTSSFHHQLSMEDQGIDLAQSPGRESPSSSSSTVSVGLKSCNSAGSGVSSGSVVLGPGSSGSSGSSCRHSTTSTTSLDSGRASGTYDSHHSHGHHHNGNSQRHPGVLVIQHQTQPHPQQVGQQQQQRFSGQSYESCLRNSYHSSSSSLGSAGSKIDDIHRLNVCEMLSQGVPEHEILNAWLTDLGFEEYYDLFVQSGYDMHTITRMTPEDLTAIGIQKPNHRKKLKSEIAQLHIPDGLPDFIPDTLEEWLALLGLAEYSPSLRRQGYRTVEDVTQLTWEDLEDFGILRLGHQKKITLAIKRVKDILAGKYVSSPLTPGGNSSVDGSFCSSSEQQQPPHLRSTPSSSHYAIPPSIMRPVYFPPQQQQIYHHYQQQHILQQQQVQQKQQQQQQQQQPIYYSYQQPTYQPDVVAIQVHRNRSSEDIRATVGPANGTELIQLQHHQQTSFTYAKPGWRQRSYEDGDVTPVSEHGHPLPGSGQPHSNHHQGHVPGGGTLPRPRGTVKPRPVAKISAKTRSDCSDHEDSSSNLKMGPPGQPLNSNPLYGTLGKKHPPPTPPKRASSSSLTDSVGVATAAITEPVEPIYASRNAKSSPLPLPPPPPALNGSANGDPTGSYSSSLAYSTDDSEDFPPPPAPISASESYLQHHNGLPHPGASSAAASVRERLDNILQRSGAGHWPVRSQQSHYGPGGIAASRSSGNSMVNMKSMVANRECSPSDSIDTSDTEPGSPAMEFRQRRNGSDASFKSTSSTESDSMPFANDNAGTIKQRSTRTHPALAALSYSSHSANSVLSPSLARRATNQPSNIGASDVLNDIGNMLADLTVELDSMLEEENSGNQPALRKK